MRAVSKDTVKRAFTATMPVMTGYLVLAIGFGILLKTKGYGVGWSIAMSGLIYAGSMQYLAIDLLCGGAGLLTTAVTTLMVNARHLFSGILIQSKLLGAWKYYWLSFGKHHPF